ncbi:hypothetical protein HQ308_14765 [Rhodococcus sp. BP-241]|uniref:hypothetical protein n=1 Tax=Rhodococcus sp. BP-241 TaxID=2739441 RepID=UPI001C9B1BB3|nr:hypothetical protein [Rhodococcus sp. BP-241]MBY6708065.1 hypothetical protein [Rhodococcus sp. BP-241]
MNASITDRNGSSRITISEPAGTVMDVPLRSSMYVTVPCPLFASMSRSTLGTSLLVGVVVVVVVSTEMRWPGVTGIVSSSMVSQPVPAA